MIDKRLINSSIYKDFSEEEKKSFFNKKSKQFLHNIDNIYYNVYLSGDDSKEPNNNIKHMLVALKEMKLLFDIADDEDKESFWFNEDRKLLVTRRCAGLYRYCISKKDCWDIFFAETIINKNTPRIHIQIRSNVLWTIGDNAVDKSFKDLLFILDIWNVEIERVMENRIDYCYHTNYLQNPDFYFSDDNLIKHAYSNLSKLNKVGEFSPGKIEYDYLSLGNRKANNIFFRTYNKVIEILDKSKKYYFFDIWLQYGLISRYDYEVFKFAAEFKKSKNFLSLGAAKMIFYIRYGKDPDIKEFFIKELKNENYTATNYNLISQRYNLLDTTVILNIEYQTMRKFYYYSDSIIDTFYYNESRIIDSRLLRIYQILDNRLIFLNYLTSYTFALVKNSDSPKLGFTDMWDRLRRTRLEFSNDDYKFKRLYPRKTVDYERAKKELKRSLARFSVISGNEDDDSINEDLSLLMSIFNDNNIDDDGVVKFVDSEYSKFKRKKKKDLKAFLNADKSSNDKNDK